MVVSYQNKEFPKQIGLDELFMEFLMEKNGTGCKGAAKDLNNGTLLTTRHVQMLLNDSVGGVKVHDAAVAQWLSASNIFR